MDIEGNGRPSGSACDIGAYEFGSSSPLAADTTTPEISNVRISNVKRRSISVTWTTDEAATTTVQYGRTTTYGKERSDTTLVVRHTITLSGLSANSRYHYRVESEDEVGDPGASANLTFRTSR